MRDPPSGRVPEQGPDWFLVATEACGGGTPDLGYFLEVSVFIGIFGVGLTSGGSLSRRRYRGQRPGGGRAPCLMASSLLPLRGLQVSRVASGPKISSVKFQVNWTPFDFPFLRYSKTRKK